MGGTLVPIMFSVQSKAMHVTTMQNCSAVLRLLLHGRSLSVAGYFGAGGGEGANFIIINITIMITIITIILGLIIISIIPTTQQYIMIIHSIHICCRDILGQGGQGFEVCQPCLIIIINPSMSIIILCIIKNDNNDSLSSTILSWLSPAFEIATTDTINWSQRYNNDWIFFTPHHQVGATQ